MTHIKDNLTAKQLGADGLSKYSVFLPALSGFYSTYIGKQQAGEYVDSSRIPADFENGVEGLNYLNADQGYFTYKWSLYSAGHANLDLTKDDPKENMIRKRDRKNTLIVGDSGGFQIAKGVWEGNWADPKDPKSEKRRSEVLKWLDGISDYAMTLDIPTWVTHDKEVGKKVGIKTYADCINTTLYNNEYFVRNRNGGAKFLNVLQGSNFREADDWYSHVKKFCDPKQYPGEHFNGWAMGGNNMSEIHLILRRLVELRYDGLLEKGVHDWMHFLGVAKLEWGCMLTDIQTAIRKYHNPNWTASMDAASAFLATANGMVYHENSYPDRGNWTYRMSPGADDKKYANDQRRWGSAMVQDGIFKSFIESPVSQRLKMSDICVYGHGVPNWTEVNADNIDHVKLFKDPALMNNPKYWITLGDKNKIDKVGATSWDSFSYALQMGHNVWTHIEAVQEANRKYQAETSIPKMLVKEDFHRIMFKDIVERVFSTSSKQQALDAIDEYDKFYMGIVGTRGLSGKKSVNAHSQYRSLFEEVDAVEETPEQEPVLNTAALDTLENSLSGV